MHVLHTFANNDHVPYLTWFVQRAKGVTDLRYSFVILFPTRPSMIDEMEALGHTCIWIRYDDAHRKRDMLLALPQMWRHIRRLRPDVVHTHLFDDAVPGTIAAWMARIKVRVTTKQDTGYHWMYARKWMFLDRLVTRLSTHIIAISGECRRFLIEKEGAPPHKIHLVHNGIPPDLFTKKDKVVMDRSRARFGLYDREPVVGNVARFVAWKGHRHIIDAARSFVEKNPKAIFLLCGNGPLEEEIKDDIRSAGMEKHILLTGWIDRAEMASFYGVLDVYMHAAVLEPFGLVYAEAMMNGVPVVSTSTGAAQDAIETDVNGVLVDAPTGEALALGLERLLALDAKAVGEAGRETALRMYPFDVMWNGTMELYRKALGSAK